MNYYLMYNYTCNGSHTGFVRCTYYQKHNSHVCIHTHTQTHTQTRVYLLIGKHQKKVLQLLVDGPHLSQLDNRVVQRTVG